MLDPVERDYEAYRRLLELWSRESSIKTTKLQFLLAVNALLLAAVVLHDGFVVANLPLYLGGAALCLVWVLSLGRTTLFQKLWQAKMAALAASHPEDPRFQITSTDEVRRRPAGWLRLLGGVPSKVYLLGAPLLFLLAWLVAAWVAARR